METGRLISARYRLAGKSTAYFAAFELAWSILAFLLLDAVFPCDPVSALLLWLGVRISRGSRRGAIAAIILSCLYILLPFAILWQGRDPCALSWEDMRKQGEWAGMLYCVSQFSWASFNTVVLSRALFKDSHAA